MNISYKCRHSAFFFIEQILISITSGLITARINNLFKKENRTPETKEPSVDYKKNYMINNLATLCEIARFDIPNATMVKKFTDIFYDLSIELILDYEFESNDRMRYISKNYGMDTSDKLSLINKLEKDRNNLQRNDCRYELGFRSLYVMMADNIGKFNAGQIQEVLRKLRPFFESFERKDLLNQYAFA